MYFSLIDVFPDFPSGAEHLRSALTIHYGINLHKFGKL